MKHLLEREGMLQKILQTKAKFANSSGCSTISDITDGKYYRSLLKDGEFLADVNCIRGIFNTDGIPLYKSAQVKLWPIFLAVNEIPLSERFSRDNMILVGIWQGKGNPPFLHYMNALGRKCATCITKELLLTLSLLSSKSTFSRPFKEKMHK